MVQSAIWRRFNAKPNWMIKPTVGCAIGIAFDMPLPFEAWWASRYRALELKGDLREGKIVRVQKTSGEDEIKLHLSPMSRRSDHQVHTFYLDCPSEFSIDEELDIWVLLIWHFNANSRARDLKHHLDVRLVLKSVGNDYWISYYGPHTSSWEDASDERVMRRLGLEAVYG
jgi:hypothetical protein